MSPAAVPAALSLDEQAFADRAILSYADTPGALLSVLERVQEHHPHKFLPPEISNMSGSEWTSRSRRFTP